MVRSRSRRTVHVVIVSSIAVFAVVVGVLLEQVVLAQSAFKLARVRERLVAQEQRHQDLLLEATRLEGSDRIERYARDVLGMVESKPQSTNYLVADVHVRDPLRSPARGKSRQLAVGQAAGGLISDRLGP
jgi:cell division protein FtsB